MSKFGGDLRRSNVTWSLSESLADLAEEGAGTAPSTAAGDSGALIQAASAAVVGGTGPKLNALPTPDVAAAGSSTYTTASPISAAGASRRTAAVGSPLQAQSSPSLSKSTDEVSISAGSGMTSSHAASGSNSFSTSKISKKQVKLQFVDELTETGGHLPHSDREDAGNWRLRDRIKTAAVALVMCLNIGVDPPDVVKTSPCARMECWIEPFTNQKALESIGKALQRQYEQWQPKAKYKLSLDPTMEEVQKLCQSVRKSAKDERVVFHYNGHGVPQPTHNGEVWVFNKNYTQYIPLSIYDLLSCLGSPSTYVFDCSSAGIVIPWFHRFSRQRRSEYTRARNHAGSDSTATEAAAAAGNHYKDYIILAACEDGQILPSNAALPADLFTACLTTPIKTALHLYCTHPVIAGVTLDMVDKLPGRLSDRRSPLGELNWIFTAVTDTIAWNLLESSLFHRLFRQDLLAASLFRNFLFAQRVLRGFNCSPVSWPPLPPTYKHSLWLAWDLALDSCISQLPELIRNPNYEYQFSPFFQEQLEAFKVWLQFGAFRRTRPEQLPILLQVLLSQVHRKRALVLLSSFLEHGPWAVRLALSVGIFPYILKMLQNNVPELQDSLVSIWARILVVDPTCKEDLVKGGHHAYFLGVLASPRDVSSQNLASASSRNAQLDAISDIEVGQPSTRTDAVFVLSVVVDSYPEAKLKCLSGNLVQLLAADIDAPDPRLRRWVALCLGKLWEDCNEAKNLAADLKVHEKLCMHLTDPVVEVRAAILFALGTFLGAVRGEAATTAVGDTGTNGAYAASLGGDGTGVILGSTIRHSTSSLARRDIDFNLGLTIPVCQGDMSSLVRRELIVALSRMVHLYMDQFSMLGGSSTSQAPSSPSPPVRAAVGGTGAGAAHASSSVVSAASVAASSTPAESDVLQWIVHLLRVLSSDPQPEISTLAQFVVGCILAEKPAGREYAGGPSILQAGSNLLKKYAWSASDALLGVRSPKPKGGAGKGSGNGPMCSPHYFDANQASLDLPLASIIYDWCAESYRSPPNTVAVDDTHPSVRLRRYFRIQNEELSRIARYKASRGSVGFAEQVAIIDCDGDLVLNMRFHPYDTLLVAHHGRDDISVWNYVDCTRVNNFSATLQSPGAKLTHISWANEQDEPLLVTASDDGVIRVWKNYASPSECTLLTSWVGLQELAPFTSGTSRGAIGSMASAAAASVPGPASSVVSAPLSPVLGGGRGDGSGGLSGSSSGVYSSSSGLGALLSTNATYSRVGMICQSIPRHGLMLCAGDSRMLRAWDIETSLSLIDVSTGSDAPVTCLATPDHLNSLAVLATGDGLIRMFDIRQKPRWSCVRTYREHKEWVLNLKFNQRNNLFSGSVNGQVKAWDPRLPNSLKTLSANTNAVTAFNVHRFAPVFVTASKGQKIRTMNFDGEELGTIRYHEGFLGQRIAPVTWLEFHPYEQLLASAQTDCIISLYRPSSSSQSYNS